MKNADMPAMPVSDEIEFWIDPTNHKAGTEPYHGLTKREHFAAMAMQGIIQNHGYENWNYLASDAVAMADALLVELEK